MKNRPHRYSILRKDGRTNHRRTEEALVSETFAKHEALRTRVLTINHVIGMKGRHPLGGVLVEYLVLIVAAAALLVLLDKCVGPASDAKDRSPKATMVTEWPWETKKGN